jgi:hypothetical protein
MSGRQGQAIELHIGRRNTGIVIRPDGLYPGMWRIIKPDGTLGLMAGLPYVKMAAMRIAKPKGLGKGEVLRWTARQTATAGRPQANAGRGSPATARRKSPASGAAAPRR